MSVPIIKEKKKRNQKRSSSRYQKQNHPISKFTQKNYSEIHSSPLLFNNQSFPFPPSDKQPHLHWPGNHSLFILQKKSTFTGVVFVNFPSDLLVHLQDQIALIFPVSWFSTCWFAKWGARDVFWGVRLVWWGGSARSIEHWQVAQIRAHIIVIARCQYLYASVIGSRPSNNVRDKDTEDRGYI